MRKIGSQSGDRLLERVRRRAGNKKGISHEFDAFLLAGLRIEEGCRCHL